MADNRGVVYLGPGKVEVQKIDFPTFRNPAGKAIGHGVILKVVATNICGSDQHMVRGRTTAPIGMVLRHEITGEVIEIGRDVDAADRDTALHEFTGLLCNADSRAEFACSTSGEGVGLPPEGPYLV